MKQVTMDWCLTTSIWNSQRQICSQYPIGTSRWTKVLDYKLWLCHWLSLITGKGWRTI